MFLIKKIIIILILISCNIEKLNKKTLNHQKVKNEYHILDNLFYSYLKTYKNLNINNNKKLKEETEIIAYSIFKLYKRLESKIHNLIIERLIKYKNVNIQISSFYYDIINKFKFFFILNTINYFNQVIPFQYNGRTFEKYNPLTCFRMLLKWFKLKIKCYKGKVFYLKGEYKNVYYININETLLRFSSYLANGYFIHFGNNTFGDISINKIHINKFIKCNRKQNINYDTLLKENTDIRLYPIITLYFTEQTFLLKKINQCFKSINFKPINFKIPDFKSIYNEERKLIVEEKKWKINTIYKIPFYNYNYNKICLN